jgi:integrase
VAYWAVSLTNNTSAMGVELRHLQMRHVFLDQEPPRLHIPDDKVKNEFRARVVPLNEVALKQVQRIVARARQWGAYRPEHYIFPFRVKRGTYDVTRPASPYFIRSAFRSMREATGLQWLQPRNFRNQIITKLFEAGAPDETIMSIAGHQSIKMSRYYSRIRITAKAEALNMICRPGREAG